MPERHGGPVVVGLLCVVVAIGFGLRMHAALNPTKKGDESSVVAYRGNDSLAYGQIAEALYEHGTLRRRNPDAARVGLVARGPVFCTPASTS